MFLFGFSAPLPLGIAVRLYKDAFHRCFNFDPFLLLFLSPFAPAAYDFGEAFLLLIPVCPSHCATSFLLSKIIIVLELQPVVQSPDQYDPLTHAQGPY